MKKKQYYFLYLMLSVIIYIGLFLYSFINGVIICLPSHIWFVILIVIIPIILLLLPLIIEGIIKNKNRNYNAPIFYLFLMQFYFMLFIITLLY